MNNLKLNNENYYTLEANLAYMSCSQWKSFHKCEDMALAEIAGEYKRPESTALLVGSYVDSYYEGTLDIFKAQHPQLFKKDGSLKAEYEQAEKIIARLERDPLCTKYMSGEKQRIMTGSIAGVPFKIKMDSYHPGKAIVDLKIVRDFEPIWSPEEHAKVPFVEFWGYDFQGAIYQEVEYQNSGVRLPFFIVAATKETTTDISVMQIPQERLDYCLAIVEDTAPRFNELKLGRIEGAERCECCDWCKESKILTAPIDYRDLNVGV